VCRGGTFGCFTTHIVYMYKMWNAVKTGHFRVPMRRMLARIRPVADRRATGSAAAARGPEKPLGQIPNMCSSVVYELGVAHEAEGVCRASWLAARGKRRRDVSAAPMAERRDGQRRWNRIRGALRLNGRFEVGDALALPFSDDAFDRTLSMLVLNFVPDPAAAMQQMIRVTRPGGVVVAAVWDYGDGMQMLRTFWDAAVALDPGAAPRDERHMPLCARGALKEFWRMHGLQDVDEQPLTIEMAFTSFDAIGSRSSAVRGLRVST
jgi:SAM-dependent methyltransferase